MIEVMERDGWTESRVELLKKLHAEGHSAARMAMMFGGGLTRNAVIGKVHRLKLPSHARPVAKRRPSRVVDRVVRLRPPNNRMKTGGTRQERVDDRREALEAEPIEVIVDTDIVGCSLLELDEKHCRWPLGDPLLPGFKFCGLPPDLGKRYCPTHHRRSVHMPGGVA